MIYLIDITHSFLSLFVFCFCLFCFCFERESERERERESEREERERVSCKWTSYTLREVHFFANIVWNLLSWPAFIPMQSTHPHHHLHHHHDRYHHPPNLFHIIFAFSYLYLPQTVVGPTVSEAEGIWCFLFVCLFFHHQIQAQGNKNGKTNNNNNTCNNNNEW